MKKEELNFSGTIFLKMFFSREHFLKITTCCLRGTFLRIYHIPALILKKFVLTANGK